MLNKVGFCHNILFWPYLIHFWAISLQNRLKMWAFLRGITWATGKKQFSCITWKACNCNCQSCLVQLCSCMNWTFKHYLPTWNPDTACVTRREGNQLLKLRMFKNMDWLWRNKLSRRFSCKKWIPYLICSQAIPPLLDRRVCVSK